MLSAPRLIMLLLLGSVVVLTQLLLQDTHKDFYWFMGLVVSAVSTGVVVVLLLLGFAGRKDTLENNMHFAVTALAAMWMAGTGIMTLKSPFVVTGNGYFGSWFALATSWLLAMHYFPSMRDPLDRLAVAGRSVGMLLAALLLASLTVFVQTAWSCTDPDYDGWCNGYAEWVLSCGAVSLVFTIALLVPRIAERISTFFPLATLVMLIWWAAGFFVGTFIHPYELTGNGFFGCWAAFVVSAMLVDATWNLNATSTAESLTRRIPRPLLLLFFASLVVALAGYWKYDQKAEVWVVCYGGFSVVVCAVLVGLALAGSTSGDKVHVVALTVGFLLIYWLLGALVMTFHGPFKLTSNGYFAAWACLGCAWILCVEHYAALQGLITGAGDYGLELSVIVFASLVLLLQAIVDVANGDVDKDLHWAAAIICPILTLVLACLIAKHNEFVAKFYLFAIAGLTAVWAAGVGVLTFERPYYFTGNAYFAAWTAFLASFLLLVRQMAKVEGPRAGGPQAPPATTVGRTFE